MKLKMIVASVAALAAGVASADTGTVASQATTAISAAQADALTVAGALTGLAIAVWGANYIRRKFFGR